MLAKTKAASSEATISQYAHQWGATGTPFSEDTPAYASDQVKQAQQHLSQSATLRSLMLLSGPNGVGKSHLVSCWKDQLNPRSHHAIAITQASLSHAGLLAYLTRKLGKPSGNRSTNLLHLEEALSELGESRTTAVIILDEAQNYSHAALEEIRLLLGLDLSRRPAFSLILIGDDYLLGSLRLRSHRALYTRIACHHQLTPWSESDMASLLESSQQAVQLSENLLAPAAQELIINASNGLPRTALQIARAAWLSASQAKAPLIEAEHVQSILPRIPSAGEQRT
jgi:general secretion pathway protein A